MFAGEDRSQKKSVRQISGHEMIVESTITDSMIDRVICRTIAGLMLEAPMRKVNTGLRMIAGESLATRISGDITTQAIADSIAGKSSITPMADSIGSLIVGTSMIMMIAGNGSILNLQDYRND